jgi:uncharacterized protein (DUF2141 family)
MIRFSIAAALLALAMPVAASAGPVRVELSGLRAGGTLYVQLQTRAQYMGADRAAGQVVRAPAAGALSVDLGEVPPGQYALTVWHDDNGNSRFDVDPRTGRPADGIAMLHAETLRAQPTFDQISFAVPAEGIALPLALHYGR